MQWPRHVSERKTAASNIHSVPNNPSEESCPQQAANTGRKSKQTRKSLSTRPLPPGRQTSSRVGLEDPGTQGQTRRGKGCLLHARAAAMRFPPRPGRRPDIQGTEAPTLAWTGASRCRTRATSQLRAVTWRTRVPGPADTHKGHASPLMGSWTCRRATSELSPRAASLSIQRQGGKGVRAGRQPGSRFWGEGQECDSFLRQDRPLHVPHQRPAGSPPPRAQGRPSPHPKHLRVYKARRRFAPNSGLVT